MANNTVRLGCTAFAVGVDSPNVSKTSPQYSHWADSSCSRLHLGHFFIVLISSGFQIKIQLIVYFSIPVTAWQEMENHHCKGKIGGMADDAAHGRFLFA